jgi:putative flippase GtrA
MISRNLSLMLLVQQLVQYLGVAVVAFALDYGAYIGLVSSGASPLAAAPVGFLLGLFCSYILSMRFVFTQRKVRRRSVEFVYFGVIGLIGLGLNELVIFLMYQALHQSASLSKIVAAGLVFGFNFSARRAVLFSTGATGG